MKDIKNFLAPGHRIIVKIDKKAERNVGGVLVPETRSETKTLGWFGTVVELGTSPDPYICKIGDRIVVPQEAWAKIHLGQNEYYIYDDDKVIGFLNEMPNA